MNNIKEPEDFDTIIEEIEVTYDMSLAIANEPSHGITFETASQLALPHDPEYAVATSIGRKRAQNSYPLPGPAQPTPVGDDLDTV